MRLSNIKVGMKVRVKKNAHTLTRSDSASWDTSESSKNEIRKYALLCGTVTSVNIYDRSIKVKFIINSKHNQTWFDAVHLELDQTSEIVSDKETEIITQLREELSKVKAELLKYKPKKFPDLIKGSGLNYARSGVYQIILDDEINGPEKFYVNKNSGEVFYVENDDIELFDYSIWNDKMFARVDEKLTITLS